MKRLRILLLVPLLTIELSLLAFVRALVFLIKFLPGAWHRTLRFGLWLIGLSERFPDPDWYLGPWSPRFYLGAGTRVRCKTDESRTGTIAQDDDSFASKQWIIHWDDGGYSFRVPSRNFIKIP